MKVANVQKKASKKARIIKQENKSIWLKMLDENYYKKLREMNNSNVSIIKWQKQRFLKSWIFVGVGLVMYLLLGKEWYYLAGGIATAIGFYIIQAKSINNIYNQFRFERHLQFSKFTRLLIPYLKQKKDGGNLYGVFAKIVKRLDYDTDKQLLMKLMQDMTDRPNDIQPFVEYAEQTSGTDMSVLFMQTIYDIRQGSADLDVIEELDRLASEELMAGIDSIIDFKSRRFVFYPTKIAMTSFILVVGFAVGVLFLNLKDINFGQ
ncbi:TPA: hypothetical protein IWN98_001262 [Enterococcus faecium]|uniref:Type II secretion system protein GspF domain-containing protein n=4 Tax=Enterococcus TaxID=1350 RepID=A0A286Q5N3_ENTAV|nr:MULTISPECIES: hypothetical protein [Enterococcus]APB62564.1 hypothetical protein pEA19081_p68 [Enterococcus avium]APB62428.1 hypothetical protein pEMA120_p17 [Enterococcus faecium]EOF89166.1 hypothetical protein SKG_02744 [Enterococcus faecium EnGen0166]EOH43451.1 hypothetical protein SSI_02906 [Enterococcus faecium EnGen0191]EOM18394.1 hypothetical protein SSM_03034 [Enterococcus faecium EnGen0192]